MSKSKKFVWPESKIFPARTFKKWAEWAIDTEISNARYVSLSYPASNSWQVSVSLTGSDERTSLFCRNRLNQALFFFQVSCQRYKKQQEYKGQWINSRDWHETLNALVLVQPVNLSLVLSHSFSSFLYLSLFPHSLSHFISLYSFLLSFPCLSVCLFHYLSVFFLS